MIETYPLREMILGELKRREWSGYRLAKESGVNVSQVNRFIAGSNDVMGFAIDKLAAAVGIKYKASKTT